jgi:DNA-binding NarL/FixJ family response regulator
MSLFERLLIWFGLIPPATPHQYRQEEDLPDLTLEPVRQEQRSEEEAYDSSSAARRAKHISPEEMSNIWEILSPREQEVTALISLGYTNSEIASKLGVSFTTVKSHIRNVLAKFQMHSKTELRIALKEWDFFNWDRPPYR